MKLLNKLKMLSICIGMGTLLTGCFYPLFQTNAERIPERTSFDGNIIEQGSFSELKRSYSAHYCKVLDELQQLEQIMGEAENDEKMLLRKINGHKQYLEQMRSYLFICPEHKTSQLKKVEKRCTDCGGDGKNFWGKVCNSCTGSGKITFQINTTMACPFCHQLYIGSISGRTLYENH